MPWGSCPCVRAWRCEGRPGPRTTTSCVCGDVDLTFPDLRTTRELHNCAAPECGRARPTASPSCSARWRRLGRPARARCCRCERPSSVPPRAALPRCARCGMRILVSQLALERTRSSQLSSGRTQPHSLYSQPSDSRDSLKTLQNTAFPPRCWRIPHVGRALDRDLFGTMDFDERNATVGVGERRERRLVFTM